MKIKLTDYDVIRIIKEYYSIANNKFVSNVDFKISEDMTEFGRHIFNFSGAEIEVDD